jgi:hypothetical protein
MKWANWRTIVGVGMVLLGILALLQVFGYLPTNGDFVGLIFGFLFAGAGAAFLTLLGRNRENWWAAIPGLVLLSLGALILSGIFFPAFASNFGGTLFMGGLSLAFLVVYFMNRENWWAIIPGGVLLTIAAITALDRVPALDTGGIFFLGLAATFAVLALIPVEGRRMSWPWIPAAVLAVMGILISVAAANLINYLWPVALILGGLLLLGRAILRRS